MCITVPPMQYLLSDSPRKRYKDSKSLQIARWHCGAAITCIWTLTQLTATLNSYSTLNSCSQLTLYVFYTLICNQVVHSFCLSLGLWISAKQ